MMTREIQEILTQEIENLKTEREERQKALPAHTFRPHQLLIIEEQENRIFLLEEKLKRLDANGSAEEGK